jgi:small subunit ribosomal protein S7e
MSQPALNKIAANSPSRANPSEIEQQIATAFYELETNVPDLKSALRPLQISSAREVSIKLPLLLCTPLILCPSSK